MASSVNRYVNAKMPLVTLAAAARSSARVLVAGIYLGHWDQVAKSLGAANYEPVGFNPPRRPKRFNTVRPAWHWVDNREQLWVLVPPSRDYVLQYASLIRHALCYYLPSDEVDGLLQVRYYRRAASELASWTELAGVVRTASRVVLGHVDELLPALGRPDSEQRNDYYCAMRYDTQQTVLLGVRYSFWGEAAMHLAQSLCQLGCRELLYLSKVGTLTGPQDVYQRVFSPSRFVLADGEQIVRHPFTVPRALPQLELTGGHITVPTVIEQSLAHRSALLWWPADSIDNEISYMAAGIDDFNTSTGTQVAFGPVAIATDYVRELGDSQHSLPFDLANNNTEEALERRQQAMQQAAGIIARHLAGTR